MERTPGYKEATTASDLEDVRGWRSRGALRKSVDEMQEVMHLACMTALSPSIRGCLLAPAVNRSVSFRQSLIIAAQTYRLSPGGDHHKCLSFAECFHSCLECWLDAGTVTVAPWPPVTSRTLEVTSVVTKNTSDRPTPFETNDRMIYR